MRNMRLAIVALSFALAANTATAGNCDYGSLEGDEITFKQTYPGGEKYGYQSWYASTDVGADSLPYAPYVGRRGKVDKGVVRGRFNTEFKRVVLANCDVVYARLINGQMPEGAYSGLDLELGKLLVGKQVWIDQTQVARPQTLATLEGDVSYPLTHLEAVTVEDLYLAAIGHAYGSGPFFLKVKKASGEQGYIAFNTRYFHTRDPIPAGTSQKIADAIKGQRVALGMTADQVILSWGKPEDVNRSVGSWGIHEQWVYGEQYVYLENGKVTSFQD